MINRKIKTLLLSFCVLIGSAISAQETIIDRVIAVIGVNPVLQSELESQYQQMENVQEASGSGAKCRVFEELLYQKLLLAQAQRDSLVVSEAQLEQELDRRLNYYIQQFGDEDRFTAFYGKSVDDYRLDLRDNVRSILLAQQMQGEFTRGLTVTPKEVKMFFEAIPVDSVPYINSEVQVGQIVKKPSVSLKANKAAKEKIEGIRTRIMKGESTFTSMAALYSEDPGSANKGGLYEHIQRGQFVPEWDSWAFKMKKNEISEVFETVYGYFIIQLIERRGNEVDARSLLIAPKIDIDELLKAKQLLDSVYTLIDTDVLTFNEAAAKYSDKEESKNNGGLMINPFTGNTRYQMDQLGQVDQTVAFAIDKLKVGEYTNPLPMTTNDGKKAYRIVNLKSQTLPHRANLQDDYQQLQEMALVNKQKEAIKTWIKKIAVDTYVRIIDDYAGCSFDNKWIYEDENVNSKNQ